MTVEIFGTDDPDGDLPGDGVTPTPPPGDPVVDDDPVTLAAEAAAFTDATIARRAAGYRRMARWSVTAGAVALLLAVVGWVFGLQTADPVYRILVVVGGLLLLVAVLSALLAVVAALPRMSEDELPRMSEDASPRMSEDASPRMSEDAVTADGTVVPDRVDED